ncbi:unnamed protein product [Linum trigynum]|uniref:Retrotransposon gag domain-containing protein n=1 Tax=Linum trigynum TaxID=586398 RepID=A0AAV2DZE5_9ROSI
MADQQQQTHVPQRPGTMGSHSRPSVDNVQSPILHPTVPNNYNEIKSGTILMLQSVVQFNGRMSEDVHAHIKSFYELTDGIKINGIPQEAIRLRLFSFTLNGAAKQWLNKHPHHSIISWDHLCNKFFARYIPPSKTALIRSEITIYFPQEEDEPLFEAWERFTYLLLKFPHHGIAD